MQALEKDRRRTSGAGGFTVVEVMVASSLLVVGVTALFLAVISSIRVQYTSNNMFHATCLARNRIQRALALPFETLPVLEEDSVSVDQNGGALADGEYSRTTRIEKLSDNSYRITVEVVYPVGSGIPSPVPVTIDSEISRHMHAEPAE
jgi:hypothetical protein